MTDHKFLMQSTLLQEGVSCALATLSAIEGADLFRMLPEDKHARDQHGHGPWLLAMLQDHLTQLQQKVGTLEPSSVAAQAEG